MEAFDMCKLSIRRTTKQTVLITREYQFVSYIHRLIQHRAVKDYSICTGRYWGLSMWIST